MSTSATVQACGIVCLLLSMLLAIARRIGLSGTVVPGDSAGAGADADRRAFLNLDLLKHARQWRRDLGIDLVRDDLNQALVFLHLVSRLLQPFRDGSLGDRFTELRHLDGGHVRSA